MEGMSPLFSSILEVEYALRSGRSVRSGLETYIESSSGTWSEFLKVWMPQFERGSDTKFLEESIKGIYKKAFLSLIKAGVKGQSVSKELIGLKEEVLRSCDREVERFIRILPLKLLIPLLFFMFPAFMLLLLGPILENLLVNL